MVLLSGLIGAVAAQLLSAFLQRKLEIRRTKLEVLRKIAGSRAAVAENPLLEHRSRFFEGLNEVMIVFSGSSKVTDALIRYKSALGTPNSNDRLIDLFKVICRDVGIEPSAFNDSLFLQPFLPAQTPQPSPRA